MAGEDPARSAITVIVRLRRVCGLLANKVLNVLDFPSVEFRWKFSILSTELATSEAHKQSSSNQQCSFSSLHFLIDAQSLLNSISYFYAKKPEKLCS